MQAFIVYYTEISRYLIALLITFYAYEAFTVFRITDEGRQGNIFVRQNILMLLIHLSCFVSIFFATGEMRYLFFYIMQVIVLLAAIRLFKLLYPLANRLLINNMCLLLSIGFAVLTRLSYERAMRQFFIATASLVLAMFVPLVIRRVKLLRKIRWIYAAVGITALATVLLFGPLIYGSRRILTIAGVTFQPSEIVKILFVFFVAASFFLSVKFSHIIITTAIAAVHVAILAASRDLGTALIFFVVFVFMVYLATGKWLYLLAGGVCGSVAAITAYHLFGHVQVRVQAFLDPWSVIDAQGYQITQSLFSIANGGLFGLGFYQGRPSGIPIVEADFIFSAIAEELGLIFAVCILLVCLSSFVMFMNIAAILNDRFYQLIAFGFGIMYIFQIFLAVGGGTRFIPMTGLTLPFISYGGSSIFVSTIIFAIVASLYIVRADETQREERGKRKQDNEKN
ncbi:MAG: FtsW/RodA/SpoVE family cell cycle protein [Lachnospiraceae bacterium]|jgi:cell division protein FtsW (lipid II flippase)|nr:FtsW/RodA/SpoVE family cell cycle protein [Lachnospiraceae bacterium]